MGAELLTSDSQRLTLKAVELHELDAWWPLVLPGIEDVRAKNPMSATPDDVLRVLRENRGWLACTMWGDDVVGVSVICADGDQFAQSTDALVWIAWTDPRNRERGIDRAVREFTQQMIDRACTNAGFRALRIHCPRFGWIKVAQELGYELQEFVFVKRLGEQPAKKKSSRLMRRERILKRVRPNGVV